MASMDSDRMRCCVLPVSRPTAVHGFSRSTIAALALLAFLLPPAASAANLAGRVSNLEGAAVPGAEITVQQNDSDFATTARTGEDGSYSLPSLPPGVYTIVIKKQGFADLTQENVALEGGNEIVQLQFRLRPAEQTVVRGVE